MPRRSCGHHHGSGRLSGAHAGHREGGGMHPQGSASLRGFPRLGGFKQQLFLPFFVASEVRNLGTLSGAVGWGVLGQLPSRGLSVWAGRDALTARWPQHSRKGFREPAGVPADTQSCSVPPLLRPRGDRGSTSSTLYQLPSVASPPPFRGKRIRLQPSMGGRRKILEECEIQLGPSPDGSAFTDDVCLLSVY